MTNAWVESVNVGQPRTVVFGGRPITSAIWKTPVSGRAAVGELGVAGDRQADLTVHGGPDKAVYAYAVEDIEWWSGQEQRTLDRGVFGENLTIRGLDLGAALIGERWAVGGTLLQVRQPRIPCHKLAVRFDDRGFPRRFAAAGRPGAYLGVLQTGSIGAGDRISLVDRPDHGVSVGLVNHVFLHDRSRLAEILAAPQLPEDLRAWALEHLSNQRHGRSGTAGGGA